MIVDIDVAGARTARMWRKLAGLYEKAAYERVERGAYDTALKCAQMADACLWQATGEGETISLDNLLGKAKSDAD